MKLEVFMSQSVTIKSNKYGINLVLNPDELSRRGTRRRGT